MSSAAWKQCFGSRRFDIELDRAVAELDSSHVRHAIARTCAETQTRSRAVTEATHGAVEDLHVLGLEGPQLGGFETGFWRRSRLLGTIPLTMTKNPKYPAAAIPYLMIRGAASAIDFYKKAFGAKETMRFPGPGGTVGHAEIRIEGGPVYLTDEGPGAGLHSPQQLGGTPVSVCIYVKDVDEFARRAEKAGATVLRPLADQFYGERTVSLQDPFGHVWHFSTVKEKLTVEQMMQRMPQ